MKKISLLLIFCFSFQGCVSISLGFLGSQIGKSKELDVVKNKDCTFEEFEQNPEGVYAFRFALVGTLIDIGLVVDYYLRVNPTGLGLFGAGVYTIYALTFPNVAGRGMSSHRTFRGWYNDQGNECKNDYFVLGYKDSLKTWEINFIKQLLVYPNNEDISQDENFIKFKKDFLRNNKIQIFGYYRYIHYPGGKAKFEEDFGKYLYKQQK